MTSTPARLSGLKRLLEQKLIPEGEAETMKWFIGLRYRIGYSLMLALTFCYFFLDIVSAQTALNLGTVVLAYLVTGGIYDYLLRRNPSPERIALIKKLQPIDKIVICTLAVYASGGVLTPMFIVYPLAILEAIILVDPKGVYRTGIAAIFSYCGLSLMEAYRAFPYIPGHWGNVDFYSVATPRTYALYIVTVGSLLMVTTYMANRISHVIGARNDLIQRQLADLRILYDIAKGLGNVTSPDDMLHYLANALLTLQNATMCIIGMVDSRGGGKIEVKASAGMPDDALEKLRNMSIATGPLQDIFLRQEPLIVEDVQANPEFAHLLVNPTSRSAYIYPVKAYGNVVGAISLSYNRVRTLSPEYNDLLLAITSQAGVALERARLFADTERLANEMSMLYDFGLYTGSTLSKDEVIKRTAGTVEKLLDPDCFYIALFDSASGAIEFEIVREQGNALPRMTTGLERGGLTAHVINTSEPLLIGHWRNGDEYEQMAKKTGMDVMSYLGVPMIAEGKVVGVISVQSEEPQRFDRHHQRLLSALAAQAAMALENARLHKVAQNQAQLDSLTKLYNHGHFVELVKNAVEASDRDDSQVALIMLDLDHFKHYNDTYGHVAGDNVLRMAANALKSSIRQTDFAGRWGGEEFGVLLPNAGVTEAKKVARIIKRAMAELYPLDGRGQVMPNPGVSQGISSYPFPAATARELIEQADGALYHAKKRGRNQFIVYEKRGNFTEATLTGGHLRASMIKDPTTRTTSHLKGQPSSRNGNSGLVTTSKLAR